MYINFPRKTFDKILISSIENGNHYATFFKDSNDIYAISMKAKLIDNYWGRPVLKVIDINTLDKQEPEFVWKVFEQTLKELDITEDF